MITALLAAALAGLASGVGALPFFVVRTIPRRLYDGILGIGAGLMLSAATLGLLGHALEGSLDAARVGMVVAGLLAGAALISVMERLVPHLHAAGHTHEHAEDHKHVRRGILLSGAMALHRLPEGFAIGAAFAAGDEATRGLGLLLATAVGFQNVCEGLVISAPLIHGGKTGAQTLLLVTLTGLPMPIMAAVGFFFSRQIGGALPFLLALAAGALITLTSTEIIPETHGHGSEAPATLGIIGGFGITIVLRATLGH